MHTIFQFHKNTYQNMHNFNVDLSTQPQRSGVFVRSKVLLACCSTLLSLKFDRQHDHFQKKEDLHFNFFDIVVLIYRHWAIIAHIEKLSDIIALRNCSDIHYTLDI